MPSIRELPRRAAQSLVGLYDALKHKTAESVGHEDGVREPTFFGHFYSGDDYSAREIHRENELRKANFIGPRLPAHLRPTPEERYWGLTNT